MLERRVKRDIWRGGYYTGSGSEERMGIRRMGWKWWKDGDFYHGVKWAGMWFVIAVVPVCLLVTCAGACTGFGERGEGPYDKST